MNLGWQPQFSLPQTVKSVAESLDTMPERMLRQVAGLTESRDDASGPPTTSDPSHPGEPSPSFPGAVATVGSRPHDFTFGGRAPIQQLIAPWRRPTT